LVPPDGSFPRVAPSSRVFVPFGGKRAPREVTTGIQLMQAA
jgi:hypothetical protein